MAKVVTGSGDKQRDERLMSSEVIRTSEEQQLLEHEKRACLRAVVDAEQQRRAARAFDRLTSTLLATQSVDDFMKKMLELLIEVAQADVAVMRLREGDQLCPRSALGLEDELSTGFTQPFDTSLDTKTSRATGTPTLKQLGLDDPARSDVMHRKGVRSLHGVSLISEEFLGAIFLGSFTDRALSDDEKQLIGALCNRIAQGIVRLRKDEALQTAIRSRDDVLSVVAHDLQNPINIISIAANTLLQRLPDSSARRPLERIIRGAQRAARLIRDLLEVNAIESGHLSLETHRVEPADLILAALESQQGLAAEASVIIATDVSPDLPLIEADEERLLEVLENLIGNAVKFTGPGGSVTVGAARHENDLLVWVKDSGSGIPSDQLPHIFDRFWQARKAERRGTGLGLTICRGIVEAHGGRIWADSVEGAGTTMRFTLPAKSRSANSSSDDVANILLVDDRHENLLSLKAILERPDYNLVTAQSGEEALSMALRERFAVALIDIAMPGMNGLEVAVHMKELERSRDIPIIFITAFGDDPQEIHRAYSAGGADYLVKPLDTEIVRKKVAVFVDLSRRRGSEWPRRTS